MLFNLTDTIPFYAGKHTILTSQSLAVRPCVTSHQRGDDIVHVSPTGPLP